MTASLAFLPFSPGMGEVLLILGAALLLFGADRLPGIARSMGRWLHAIRRTADDFHDQLLDAVPDSTTGRPRSGTKTDPAIPKTDMPRDADMDAGIGRSSGKDDHVIDRPAEDGQAEHRPS